MTTASVHWPFAEHGIFVYDRVGAPKALSPEFYAWCTELANWKLDLTALDEQTDEEKAWVTTRVQQAP